MILPTQLELNVGETYTLELPGLGAAGYIWTYEIVESSDVVDISSALTTKTSLSSDKKSLLRIGSSNSQIFIINAKRAGHTTLRFTQKRPWERKQKPIEERMVEVFIHSQEK